MVLDPDLLLMDEPFSSLDAITREEMQNLIVELGLQTRTSILVTHSIEEAVFLGKRILVLPRYPISMADTFENPGARRLTYRSCPEFHQVCAELRRKIALL